MPDETRAPLTVKEVHAAASVLLRERHHMGFRNFLGDLLLESRDPFAEAPVANRSVGWEC